MAYLVSSNEAPYTGYADSGFPRDVAVVEATLMEANDPAPDLGLDGHAPPGPDHY